MTAITHFLTTVAALAVVLGVLVFVHEAGHFLAAKWAGIYVHRFSLGLGAPIRALSFTRGETEYSVSWLPLGGYVKMASREEEATSAALEGGTPAVAVPADRMFEAKPVWKRMVVILAGVTMNAVFAFLVYSGLAFATGEQLVEETRVGAVVPSLIPAGGEALRSLQVGDTIVSVAGVPVTTWDEIVEGIQNTRTGVVAIGLAGGRRLDLRIHPDALKERMQASAAVQPFAPPVVNQVVDGQPAARAGVQVGDTVLAISGQPITQWRELPPLIERHVDAPVTLSIARGASHLELTMTTRSESVTDSSGARHTVGRVGIGGGFPRMSTRPFTVGGALAEGWHRTEDASTQVWRTLRGLVSGRVAGRELGGPILIGQLAGQTARMGPEAFLSFMALISINLAVLNLLPVPVLDGGQFMFLLGEAVLRRPLPLKLRERLTMVGLALIVCLMVFAFWNDIRRLVEGMTRG
jgi:regulator of sigma E protease